MKINEVISKMKKGDKAVSYTWKLTILHDDDIVINKCPDYPHLEGNTVSLTGMILGIEDFKVVPKQITDYNEIKKILTTFEEDKRLTLITPDDNLVYYFQEGDFHANLDFLTMKKIFKGKWFEGHHTKQELISFGFIEEKNNPIK